METNPTLQQIYNNLQDGRIYGYDFTKCKYPFFDPVLYLTKGGYIGWHHYGSSAAENKIEDLDWLIREIFRMTPEEFVQKYIMQEQSKL